MFLASFAPKCEQFVNMMKKSLTISNRAARQVDFDCAPVAHGKLFADRAYADTAWAETLRSGRAIELITPRKKKPSDTLLSGDCLNSSVASCRQPIESFFNWLQIKSGIQSASHVRSLPGLFFLIFSSLAFSLLLLRPYY